MNVPSTKPKADSIQKLPIDRWVGHLEENELPIGITELNTVLHGTVLHILDLFAEHPGNGAGSRAMKEILADAEASGVTQVRIASFLAAVPFWERLGFVWPTAETDDGYALMQLDVPRAKPTKDPIRSPRRP